MRALELREDAALCYRRLCPATPEAAAEVARPKGRGGRASAPAATPVAQWLWWWWRCPQSGALSQSGVRVTCRTSPPWTRAVKMSGWPAIAGLE